MKFHEYAEYVYSILYDKTQCNLRNIIYKQIKMEGIANLAICTY